MTGHVLRALIVMAVLGASASSAPEESAAVVGRPLQPNDSSVSPKAAAIRECKGRPDMGVSVLPRAALERSSCHPEEQPLRYEGSSCEARSNSAIAAFRTFCAR